jgi:hypothetical protein
MTIEVLEPDEVARIMRCSVTTVERRARTGDLPGLKFGDGWVFPVEALRERLSELAKEEAAKRRKPAKGLGQIVAVPAKRTRREPPSLPDIPLPR